MIRNIICKRCNKTVMAQLEVDGELTSLEKYLIDEMSKTPCSKCVPTDKYIEELENENLCNKIH